MAGSFAAHANDCRRDWPAARMLQPIDAGVFRLGLRWLGIVARVVG
jgi:hypothetical protein